MTSELDEALASIELGPSRILVGVDLGTTFTGFKFCERRDPNNIYGYYDWPSQAAVLGRPYCKTSTSSLYACTHEGGAELLHIGHPAVAHHMAYLGVYVPEGGECQQVLLQRVKLQLAGGEYENQGGWLQLPCGLTVHHVLSEYLAKMKQMAVQQVRSRLGAYIRESDIQWCLTVPAIWNNAAKEEMKKIAKTAGLVGPRGSQHPLLIVLEPEAAAISCDRHMSTSRGGLEVGDVFMVADVGGGTTDLIVLQKLEHSFREVVCGSGDLCGGVFVDKAFHDWLANHIGPCFDAFEREDPCQALVLATWWDTQKRSFTGVGYPLRLDLPVRLVNMWMEQDRQQIRRPVGVIRDKIIIGVATARSFFDPTVDRILELIGSQLERSPECKYLFAAGGCVEAPYLANRIRDTFSQRVTVVQPPEPGAAVCQGAVLYGLDPSIISERTSRKTYGIRISRPFRAGDPAANKYFHQEQGRFYVHNAFFVFVRNGDSVPVGEEITHAFAPSDADSTSCDIQLLSTRERDPEWSTDPGVESWTCFTARVAPGAAPRRRSFDVRLKFGGTSIEVTAFGSGLVETKQVQAGVAFESRFGG